MKLTLILLFQKWYNGYMKTIENSTKNKLNNDNHAEESIEALQNKCALLEQENQELSAKVAWYEEQIDVKGTGLLTTFAEWKPAKSKKKWARLSNL